MNKPILAFLIMLSGMAFLTVSGADTGPARKGRPTDAVHSVRSKTGYKTSVRQLPSVRTSSRKALFPDASKRLSPLKTANRENPLKVREGLQFWGSVIYSAPDPWTGEYYHNGINTITATGDFEAVVPDFNANAGGFVADGIYYGVNYANDFGDELVTATKYDVRDWSEKESITLDVSFRSTCLTYDKTTSTVYGCYADPADPSKFWFGSAVYDTPPSVTPISEIPETSLLYNALFTDDAGQVFAIDMHGDLYKVDKTDGKTTKVGPTGFTPKYYCGATFDSKSGKAYWTLAPDDDRTYLIEIDPATGEGVQIHQFEYDDEITGLAIASVANDKAPAAPSSLNLDFGGELTGIVSFDMPSTLYDGSVASGNATYAVNANGACVATGTASYGEHVETEVTLPCAGEYVISVFCSNSDGDGPVAKLTQFIGKDIPVMPMNVTAERTGGLVIISWDAVTETVNGGYMDPSEVRYRIVRMPDSVTVADNISETSVSDEVDDPENGYVKYSYTVTALYGENESYPGISNSIGFGSMTPPYFNAIESEDDFGDFLVIDANEDGRTWILNSTNAQCSYHETNMMDDYLVLPPMKLEKGKVYIFSMEAWARWNERVEVVYGTAPTPEALTRTVCAPVEINDENPTTVEGTIIPEETGVYHIAVHGISDPDQFMLFVDNISLSGGLATDAPGPVENVSLIPDPKGEKTVEIGFSTPALSIGGFPLAELSRVDIYREDSLIKTFDNPAPQSQLSFIDRVEESGTYHYTFKPFNAEGEGMSASASVYIGINIPGEPTNVKAIETSEAGEVTISWTAPENDCDGHKIDPALLDYTVVEYNYGDYIPVAEGITETSYTYQAVAAGEPQALKQYAVFAHTEAGSGYGGLSKTLAVGEPYGIPYRENFANQSLSGILGMHVLEGYPEWNLYEAYSFTDIDSDATGDGGFIGMSGESFDDAAMIYTGKISLDGAASPAVSFYTFNIAEDDDNEIAVMVKSADDEAFYELKSFVIKDACSSTGWNKFTIPLDQYAGKTIQIGLKASIKSYTFVLIDGIKIAEVYDHDLSIARVAAPATITPDIPFDVTITVDNNGLMPASGYNVQLIRNGLIVDECEGTELPANERTTFSFTQTLNVTDADVCMYEVMVDYPADGYQDDNISSGTEVKIKKSGLPMPENLTLEESDGNVCLTWDAPDLSNAVVVVTEDFEDCESFATDIRGWSFVDVDASPIGHFSDYSLPLNIQGSQSFWIHDSSWSDFSGNPTFAAHSGMKCLASMFRADNGTVDDWAISPILSGEAQTISFYAKSYDGMYPETVEVLYSTGGTDITDFSHLETFYDLPIEWSLYEFDVPEGATYFAIRSIATGSLMLLIDDISYISGEASNLTLIGYNVYRDGIRINPETIGTTEYTDHTAAGEEHRYDVSSVYIEGESRTISAYSGKEGVGSIITGNIHVRSSNGHIEISGATGLEIGISTVDGKCIFNGIGSDPLSVPVEKGIYLVRTGGRSFKILVE